MGWQEVLLLLLAGQDALVMDCAPHRTPAEARCWGDARNWTLGCLYRCPQDPRVWVPKHGAEHRARLTQVLPRWAVDLDSTLNFAHSEAWAFVAACGGLVAWGVAGSLRDRR